MSKNNDLKDKLRKKILEKKAVRNKDMNILKSSCQDDHGIDSNILEALEQMPNIKKKKDKVEFLANVLKTMNPDDMSKFADTLMQTFKNLNQPEAITMLKDAQHKLNATPNQKKKKKKKKKIISDTNNILPRPMMTETI